MWTDQMRVHSLLEGYIKEAGLEEMMRNRLDMRYVGMAFGAIYNEVNGKSKAGVKYKVDKVKEICGDEKLKLSLERIHPIRGSAYTQTASRRTVKKKSKAK